MDDSLQKILTLRREGQEAAIWLINSLRAAGLPAIVVSARRTASHQRRLIASGATIASRSRHLSGRALDVGFQGVPAAQVPWSVWSYAGALWEAAGGRWGGRFSDPDPLHFDW